MLPNLTTIETAAQTVYSVTPPTPQYCWPLLAGELGCELWLKHENHTIAGAFKVRGGIVYLSDLVQQQAISGVIAATRGNHGQSVGLAAKRLGLKATIVVPHGNSHAKNRAMQALGVNLLEYGEDFQAAREHAEQLAQEQNWHMVPPFHPLLTAGVATYCLEFLRAVPDLQRVYVPIGLGSGICAMAAARNALGLSTEIVGVVSAHARAYAESFTKKTLTESPASTALADGMACRTPHPEALDIIWREVSRIVEVTDTEITNAIRLLFTCTHNVSEGAGAAALAAAIQEKHQNQGNRIGVVLSGGNIDEAIFSKILKCPTSPAEK